jgi:hypothetical protein
MLLGRLKLLLPGRANSNNCPDYSLLFAVNENAQHPVCMGG